MLTIHTNAGIHKMSAKHTPAAACKSGDTVAFETLDCFSGQLQSEDQLLGGIDWSHVNPATGPLYVDGADVGDVLKVEILKIEIADHGVIVDAPGEGVTGAKITDEKTKIVPIVNGKAIFNEKLSFPVKPMIGVIGTAPAEEEISTGTPGPHGGNMDNTQIGEGCALYLPVNAKGALLAMGDLHAIMGDGEVCVCGVEIAGRVTVKVTAVKNCGLPTPFLVTQSAAIAIYSAASADAAGEGAILRMHDFLVQELAMDAHEAGMLLSAAGNLRVCQVVDPLRTFRMEIPLEIAEAYGYRFA